MKKKVLILAGIPWETTIQRHHQIASFFYKMGYEVFFVEKIPSSKFSFKKAINRINRKKIIKAEFERNMEINVINPKFINPMNGVFFLYNKMKIKKLIKNIGNEFDIVINYLPVNTTYEILKLVNAPIVVYDCVRDFQNWGEYPSNVANIEENIVNKADFILTDSYYLTNKIKKNYNKNAFQILPMVDKNQIEILNQCKIKNKITNIIYFGAINNHIDCEILNNLAKDGYKVHIIGEIQNSYNFEQNVILHGFTNNLIHLSNLIVKYADAIIIPYKGNMDGVIPAKLMQCFATGLPIYICKFYDSVKLEELLYLYTDYQHLKKLIQNFDINMHSIVSKKMLQFSKINSEELQFKKLYDELIKNNKFSN